MQVGSDIKSNTQSGIYTALTSFNLGYSGESMTIGTGIPTLDPTRLKTLQYQSNVTGVDGTWTSSGGGENSPVVGTTYYMSITATLLGGAVQPLRYRLVAVAATTSFTDLATQFINQINTLAKGSVQPFPGSAVLSSSHLLITEVPPTGYGPGECLLNVTSIADKNNVLITNFAAGTAHVNPIGGYAAIQRAYLATTTGSIGPFNTNPGATPWIGSAPVSTSAYDVITVTDSPVDKPTSGSGNYYTWRIFVDTAITGTTTTRAYLKGAINNFAGQAGLAVGDTVPVVPVATTAAGTAIIPSGANSVSVTGNASNFILLPQSYPVGKVLTIKGDGTAYKIQVSVGVAYGINLGTAGTGSATIPASLKLTCVLTTPTNWEITGALLTGAYPTTTESNIPANS